MEVKVPTGKVKILKHFSQQKNLHVLGGRMEEGFIKNGQKVQITRRDIEVGKGVVKNLQQQKSDVQRIDEGEFGMQVESKADIAPGDYLIPFDTEINWACLKTLHKK